MASVFCSNCAHENEEGTLECVACGYPIDPTLEHDQTRGQRRPTHWRPVAIMAGVAAVAFLIMHFTGASVQLEVGTFVHVDQFNDGTPVKAIFSKEGMGAMFLPMLGFIAAAVAVAVAHRARLVREVVFGSMIALAIQALVWLVAIDFELDVLTSGQFRLEGEGHGIRGPAIFLLPFLLTANIFVALAVANVSWVALEVSTKQAGCTTCLTRHDLEPKPPLRCGKCQAIQERDGIQWVWVILAGVGSAVAVGLVVKLFGSAAGFHAVCDLYEPTDGCKEAWREAYYDDNFQRFRNKGEGLGIIFHQWKYLGITAGIMAVAPLLIAWRVPGASRGTALLSVPISWFLGTLVGIAALAAEGGFEAMYAAIARAHVFGVVVWGAGGFAGVLIGTKLRYSRSEAFLEDLDDE